MQSAVVGFLETPRVRDGVLAVIILNALVIGLQTSDSAMAAAGTLLELIDRACLFIFVLEILLKLYAHRLSFFRSGWNIFDVLVVGLSLGPVGGVNFSVLRALRVLRLMRVVSISPHLRLVIEGMLRALPGLASMILLLALIYYVSAVVATQLYGDAFPKWFGTLGVSAFSLFQVMTLEGWPDIARSVMDAFPNAWAFFVVYIMGTNFCVLNLVVGLIVASMESAHSEGQQEKTDAYQDQALAMLQEISGRIEALERADAERAVSTASEHIGGPA